jgi:hypothetical protein
MTTFIFVLAGFTVALLESVFREKFVLWGEVLLQVK